MERKDDLVQDFTIVKEVLGLGENRTALPHAFTNAEEESESNASRTFFLNEITNAENKTGTIILDKKRYKLILMVKALIDKILESKNPDYYILEKEYIRTYRILLKEII